MTDDKQLDSRDRPSLQDVDNLLTRPERQYLEYKSRIPSDSDLARTLTAFANAEGGVLVIGVKKSSEGGEVLGLSDQEVARARERLRALASSLIPAPVPIDEVEVHGRRIVYASVNPVPKHLGPATTAEGNVYVRLDSRDRAQPRRKVKVERRSPRDCRVFVAMSFREEEEPSLVDYYEGMKRAAARTRLKMRVRRVDELQGDFEISQQVMSEIDQADIVLTDFTLSASNVYFELGYARGLKKRIIQMARRGTSLEFDVRNWKTVFYKNATELEEQLIPALQEAYGDWVASS